MSRAALVVPQTPPVMMLPCVPCIADAANSARLRATRRHIYISSLLSIHWLLCTCLPGLACNTADTYPFAAGSRVVMALLPFRLDGTELPDSAHLGYFFRWFVLSSFIPYSLHASSISASQPSLLTLTATGLSHLETISDVQQPELTSVRTRIVMNHMCPAHVKYVPTACPPFARARLLIPEQSHRTPNENSAPIASGYLRRLSR